MSEKLEITVLLFSHLRHTLKKDRLTLELDAGATSADADARVRELLPAGMDRAVFRVAVNQSVVKEPVALSNGDEIALLPPMQGG